jgi:hypothetical protein
LRSRPPIGLIVEADEPVLFFSTIKAAETYMEPIDVRDGVYKAAYDVRGNSFAIDVVDDHVVICPNTDTRCSKERLRELLINFLSELDVVQYDEESLEELLEKCRPYVVE